MSKPLVRYTYMLVPPVVGGRAIIRLAESHHTLSDAALAAHDNVVTTSTVQSVEDDTGRFETRNTLYVPDERPGTEFYRDGIPGGNIT